MNNKLEITGEVTDILLNGVSVYKQPDNIEIASRPWLDFLRKELGK